VRFARLLTASPARANAVEMATIAANAARLLPPAPVAGRTIDVGGSLAVASGGKLTSGSVSTTGVEVDNGGASMTAVVGATDTTSVGVSVNVTGTLVGSVGVLTATAGVLVAGAAATVFVAGTIVFVADAGVSVSATGVLVLPGIAVPCGTCVLVGGTTVDVLVADT